MDIATNLQNIMDAKNLNASQLSELSGVKLDTIKSILYHRSNDPKISTIIALADSLEVSIETLVLNHNLMDSSIIELYNQCLPSVQSTLKMIASNNIVRQNMLSSLSDHQIKVVVPSGSEDDGIINDTCETMVVSCHKPEVFIGYMIKTNNFFDYSIYKGDIILLERRDPEDNELAVFTNGCKSFLRKLEIHDKCYVLKGLNKKAKDIVIKFNERDFKYTCIGTYVGKIEKAD